MQKKNLLTIQIYPAESKVVVFQGVNFPNPVHYFFFKNRKELANKTFECASRSGWSYPNNIQLPVRNLNNQLIYVNSLPTRGRGLSLQDVLLIVKILKLTGKECSRAVFSTHMLTGAHTLTLKIDHYEQNSFNIIFYVNKKYFEITAFRMALKTIYYSSLEDCLEKLIYIIDE